MKRKTNLFYSGLSTDSNFLTFSNYPEALTGNIMSTDNKIYPSKFLCLQLDFLNDEDNAKKELKTIQDNLRNKILSDTSNETITLTHDCKEGWFTENGGDNIHQTNNITWTNREVLTPEMNAELHQYSEDGKGNVVANIYYKDRKLFTTNYDGGNDNGNTITVKYALKELPVEYDFLDKLGDTSNLNASTIYALNKRKLIEQLVAYYENKLATIRDWCIANNYNQEAKMRPLSWLLATLIKLGWDGQIQVVGDVTEQDWNGSFADTICVLDLSHYKKGEVKTETDYTAQYTDGPTESMQYLHGWWQEKNKYNPELDFDHDGIVTVSVTKDPSNQIFQYDEDLKNITDVELLEFIKTHNISSTSTDDYNTYIRQNPKPNTEAEIQQWQETLKNIIKASEKEEEWHGPKIAKDLAPIYDKIDAREYDLTSDITSIELNNGDAETLKFNVLIPLYDLTDTNYQTNSVAVADINSINLTATTDDETKLMSVQNVPLGIWFSGATPITLSKDTVSGFAPSWSLCLSSQFKPFPYSTAMPSEITDDSKKIAFATFAQVLSRQNTLIDKIDAMTNTVNALSSRVSSLESQLGSILTSYNIDSIKQDISDYKTYINNKIDELQNSINALDLKWIERN